MTQEHDLSRRQLLKYSGVATATVAGCLGGSGGSQTTTAPEDTETAGEMTGTDEPTTTDEETATTGPSIQLAVEDQDTDDRTVTVPQVAIDGDGWLVVHPEADGGGPNGGVVLGATMLSAGQYENVELELDRVTEGGATVYAMLHYDDPADGDFTFPQNGDPPVTKDGSPVVEPFEVGLSGDATPALSVTDQETDGSSVTVPSAAIDQTGWLVVHPEAEGDGPNGGVVLAKRQLAPGRYANRTLSLSSPVSSDQTLYAMLHYDDPADGEFTFPQNGDPPTTKDGSPVVEPFEVTVTGEMSAETTTVEAVSTSFDPKRVSVSPGTTVKWVNEDSYGHDVTSATFHDKAKDWQMSASLAGDGGAAEHTFDEPGVYEYYCTIHGKTAMCGAVLVGDVSLDKALPCEETSSDDGGSSGDGGGGSGDGDSDGDDDGGGGGAY